jgi:hypothetical protein
MWPFWTAKMAYLDIACATSSSMRRAASSSVEKGPRGASEEVLGDVQAFGDRVTLDPQ